MKLSTIKASINRWNELNDYYQTTQFLLQEGIIFRLNPNLTKIKVPNEHDPLPLITAFHIYLGVLEESIIIFMINNVMDSKASFDYLGEVEITNYIYKTNLETLDPNLLSSFTSAKSISWEKYYKQPEEKPASPFEGHKRILQWSMSKQQWIRNQIDNVNGLFTAFSIPVRDQNSLSLAEWFGILALKENKRKNQNLGNPYLSDLIIWNYDNFIVSTIENSDNFYDTVGTVPPYNQSGITQQNSFYLSTL